MAKTTLHTGPCIALIGDMVRSREVPRMQRPKVQEKFEELIRYLNKVYSQFVLSKFVITLGDEFQGLLLSATPIPDLMWDIEQRFCERDLRVGMGLGILHTPLQKEAINIDGPALYNARAAIQTAAKNRLLGGVFVGFYEMDPVMNGIARILSFHRSKLTEHQLRIAELLRRGLSQSEAASELGVTRQVISKQVKSTGWESYAEAESAWRIFIEKCINPKLEKKRR
jgi:predicted DNA-binding protein YlxM (UPF0122 family)